MENIFEYSIFIFSSFTLYMIVAALFLFRFDKRYRVIGIFSLIIGVVQGVEYFLIFEESIHYDFIVMLISLLIPLSLPYFYSIILEKRASVIVYILTIILFFLTISLEEFSHIFFTLPFIPSLVWLSIHGYRYRGIVEYNGVIGLVFIQYILLSNFVSSFIDCSIVLFLSYINGIATKRLISERDKKNIRLLKVEGELLRKIIQPHYLLNSLNALLEWLESDPKLGVKMVEALFKEFKLFLKISEKRSIEISEEIELVKAHLDVVNLRGGGKFDLSVNEFEKDIVIPPAILLTLAENSITYQKRGVLSIDIGRVDDRITITFSSLKGESKRGKGFGTGYRYIRTRLEEMSSEHWRLDHYSKDDQYITEIEYEV